MQSYGAFCCSCQLQLAAQRFAQLLNECDYIINYLISGTNGETIYYDQKIANTEDIWLNNKDCLMERVLLNKIEAYIYSYSYDNGNLTELNLIWKDDYIFILSSEQVSKETLIQIAETMQ